MTEGVVKPEDQEPDTTGFEFYQDAFAEIGTARHIGMGVGPIPFTAIADYFRMYELQEDFDEFAYVIRRMDCVYLELNAEGSEKAPAKGKAKKNGAANSNKKNPNQG